MPAKGKDPRIPVVPMRGEPMADVPEGSGAL
jgi:hypothetical protein